MLPRKKAGKVTSDRRASYEGSSTWRWAERLFQETDIAALVAFRIWLGLILFWEVTRYFERDWIYSDFLASKFQFKYYGFSWVRVWQGVGIYFHFLALGIAALCVMIGLAYRMAAIATFVLFTYLFLLDQTHYLNHFYLVCLVTGLMVFLPAHRAMSVDAWLRPSVRSSVVPAWTTQLLRVQLAIVYIYAAFAKMEPDWLLRGEPMRMWLAERQDLRLLGPLIPIGRWFTQEWFVYGMSWGGFLFDLLVVPLMLWPKTRSIGFLWCVAFHLTNAYLFNIGIFPWFMLGATLLYFGDDWPRKIFNWPRIVDANTASRPTLPRANRVTASLLVAYVAFQLLFPLRHLLYPGPVNWTEEGHRFSWHMKLRDKQAEATVRVSRHDGSQTEEVSLDAYLTKEQQRKMAGRPDMLLQFSHYVAADYEKRWGERPIVTVESLCSLNGRPERPLVDPNVDLASQPRDLWPARWIKLSDED